MAAPSWSTAGVSIIGQRRAQEDAWVILQETVCQREPVLAAAVFDGVGGHANGREAAHAAAHGFNRAVRQAMVPGDILHALQPAVLVSGGSTTAVAIVLPLDGSGGFVLGVGDSAAFATDQGGKLLRIVPLDRHTDGRITDWLPNALMRGHHVEFQLRKGSSVILCSDGVDGVVADSDLLRALQEADVEQALQQLMTAVKAAGAPDNATAVLIRRN